MGDRIGRHAAASGGSGGRRWRALLAGGLVLGVGGAITLAAWSDTEVATGTFAASVFGTESQSAGSPAYASNTAAPGANLTFNATAMSPGVAHYAWLNVRTTPTTNVAGSVALSSIANDAGALVPALQYRAVRMAGPSPSSSCGAASFTGSPVFIAGGPTTYLAATAMPTTPIASAIGTAGTQLGYCFEVRIAPGSANTFQGTTATVTWQFTATSNE